MSLKWFLILTLAVLLLAGLMGFRHIGGFSGNKFSFVLGEQTAVAENYLNKIISEGGDSNYVIFVGNPQKNYYVQFAAKKGATSLRAEAVGNRRLSTENALSDREISRMKSWEWNEPDEKKSESNFYKTVEASSTLDRKRLAQEMENVFTQIYGVKLGEKVEVTLHLE